MMRSLLLPPLVLAPLAACGDDGGAVTPDAAPTPDAAYDTARCLITGHYGGLGALSGTSSMGATTLTLTLDSGPPRDTLFIKLEAGKGAFTGGLANGTFPITGDDAAYLDCGVCFHIIADIVTGQGPSKFYFADAGTVTLTSTAPPSGSAQGLHFREVNTATGAFVPGGCEATIDSVSF